jgi:hypothetical protein
MRVGLIGCSKDKLDHPAPAHELYQGQFFKLTMQYIVRSVVIGACNAGSRNEWGILSAAHGLVLPDQVVAPYDKYLGGLLSAERKQWETMVHEQLMERWGDGVIYTVVAGYDYRSAVKQMSMVEDPIAHWTEQRRARGMTNKRAAMGIGVLKKHLKQEIERRQWIQEETVETAIREGGYTFEKWRTYG